MTDANDPVAGRREEWVAAVNGRDLDAYVELVTEDLAWLPPSGEPIRGRSAFRRWLAPFFDAYRYDFSLETTRVRALPGWCAEAGRFRTALTPIDSPERDPMEHSGRYVVLWRLEPDGAWRIERYIDGL